MICEPLGLIQQVYVGLYDPDAFMDDSDEEPKYVNLQINRHNQWNCGRILVTDSKDGETYVFNINQWILATPEIDRYNAIAARPAELRYVRPPASSSTNCIFNSSRAPKVAYKIVVETGDVLNAGTTANVYITLYGKQNGATSGSQRLQRTTNQTFAQGRVDIFFVFCARLDEVSRVQIEHDNSGASPDWFVKSITVKEVDGEKMWNFPCNSWISLTQGGLRKELRAE
nr:hypothetical transcript [Hymenolepis microstoma]